MHIKTSLWCDNIANETQKYSVYNAKHLGVLFISHFKLNVWHGSWTHCTLDPQLHAHFFKFLK